MLPLNVRNEYAKSNNRPQPYSPSMPLNSNVRSEIRDGSKYCFPEASIWYYDDFNKSIFSRTYEVDTLVARTNELSWFQEPTQNQVCFKRVLAEQQYFDNQSPQCANAYDKNYNSHYELPVPEHDLANIRNVNIENSLFRLGHLLDEDCLTDVQQATLINGKSISDDVLAQQFKYYTAFPNITKRVFDTNTSQLLKTVDNRNKYILYSNNMYPYDYVNKGLKS